LQRCHVHNFRLAEDAKATHLSGFLFMPFLAAWHGRNGLLGAIALPALLFGFQWAANVSYSTYRCAEAAKALPDPMVSALNCETEWTCHPLALELSRIDANARNEILIEECRPRRPVQIFGNLHT